MKEQTLIEMGKKVDSLIRVSQKLIQEIQQIDYNEKKLDLNVE